MTTLIIILRDQQQQQEAQLGRNIWMIERKSKNEVSMRGLIAMSEARQFSGGNLEMKMENTIQM